MVSSLLFIIFKIVLIIYHLLVGAILTLFISIITPYIWIATFDTLLLLFRLHDSHISLVLGIFWTFVCGRYILKYWLWEFRIIWKLNKIIRPAYIEIPDEGVEGYRIASI